MTATSASPAPTTSLSTREAGRVTAEWLVKQARRQGRHRRDHRRARHIGRRPAQRKAAKEVFAKYPDIKIVGEAVGMWSQAVARTELSKILATRSWDQINGLWMQVGCYTANSMQIEAGKTPKQLLPCAGEGVEWRPHPDAAGRHRGRRCQRPIAPIGAPRISYASPPYSGALALKLAVEARRQGRPKRVTDLPLPIVTNETVKLCKEGTWQEMKDGCNAFLPSLVSNPGLVRLDLLRADPRSRPRRRTRRPAGTLIAAPGGAALRAAPSGLHRKLRSSRPAVRN